MASIRFRFSPFLINKSEAIRAASRMVSLSSYCICVCFFNISNFMKPSAVYEASLCTFVLRSETMICLVYISVKSFKKHLVDIFSPRIK